jgi:dihydroorotate dehydrogenase (fumarate)
MGLTLRNPIIIGSSGLTNSVKKIKELEAAGAGAVVLKSIFEEQILMEAHSLKSEHVSHSEAMDLLRQYTEKNTLDEYLKLIEDAKKEVSIPVIASINCSYYAPDNWVSFAKKIEKSGADALELNVFVMPADYKVEGENIEKGYFEIVSRVREQVDIPIAVKMSFYFSGLANMIFNLSVRRIEGIVLFNRFYRPDIDLDKMEVVSSHVFSSPEEITLPLRWVGILSGHTKCDLAASTGIHDGHGVVKCLLVGAKAVQVATTIYKNGPAYIGTMLDQVKDWMKKHKYTSIKDFNGKLRHDQLKDPMKYERSQFMKYFADSKI